MKSILPVINPKSNHIVFPNLHDSVIYGIKTRNKLGVDSVYLEIMTEDKKYLLIELVGVERFIANEFFAGNIIFDVTVINKEKLNLEKFIKEFHASLMLTEKEAEEYRNGIREGLFIYVSNSTSWGCEFKCICRELLIFETEKGYYR